MSNPDADAAAPLDPKEQMRAALEAKKTAQHIHADSAGSVGKGGGGQQGKQGGKREFRRKSGG